MPTATMLCASCATVVATAPRRRPKPAHQAEADAAGRVMALDDRDLRQVALGVGDHPAVADARREHEVLRPDLIPDRARSRARARRAAARAGTRPARQRRDAHAVAHPVRRGRGCRTARRRRPRATTRPSLSTSDGAERAEVVEQDAVGAVARRDRADPRQAVAERRVQRREQQCVLGRDALGDRDAAHLVDVALAQQEVGLAVVGAERAALGPEARARAAAGRAGCGRSRPRAAAPRRPCGASPAPRSAWSPRDRCAMPVAR